MAQKNKTNISPYKTRQAQRNPRGQGPGHHSELQGRHKTPDKVYSLEEANDRLNDLFRNHDFGHITHAQRRQLAHFYTLLMESQSTENFTRLLKLRDVGIRHFIDCLIVPQLTTLQFPLMDVGTGLLPVDLSQVNGDFRRVDPVILRALDPDALGTEVSETSSMRVSAPEHAIASEAVARNRKRKRIMSRAK